MKNITVKINAVYKSNEREGMLRLPIGNIDEATDIIKKIASEMLSFPEKEVSEEDLKQLIPKDVIPENIHYGNKMHTIKWLDLGYKSDLGKVRDLDEDSIVIVTTEVTYNSLQSNCSLFILGDGVGGHRKGEIASYLGTKTVAEELLHLMLSISTKPENEIENSIISSIKKANTAISDYAKINPEFSSMATTLAVALLKDQQLYVGNVGDSRVYLINDGIRQITKDHSLVQEMVEAGRITKEEARNHPQKNIITRAVGSNQDVNVDIFQEKIYKEDIIMLCCDGLSDVLRDEQIRDIIIDNKTFTNACDELIKITNDKGGPDNISVIVSRSKNLPSKPEPAKQEIVTARKEKPERKRLKILVPVASVIGVIILLLIFIIYTLPVNYNENLILNYYESMNNTNYNQLPLFSVNDSNASRDIVKYVSCLNNLSNISNISLDNTNHGFEIINIKRDTEGYEIEVNDRTRLSINNEINITLDNNSTVKYYTKRTNSLVINKILHNVFSEWKIYDIKWYDKNGNEKESYFHAKGLDPRNLPDSDIKGIFEKYYNFSQ